MHSNIGYLTGRRFGPGGMIAGIACCLALYAPFGGIAHAAGICDNLSVLGKWQGTAMQPGYGVYPMELEINGVTGPRAGKVAYPTLGCGGSLSYVKQTADCVHQYRETIEYGGGKCVNGGLVNVFTVTTPTSRFLQWTWSYPDGRVGATAGLQQQTARLTNRNNSPVFSSNGHNRENTAELLDKTAPREERSILARTDNKVAGDSSRSRGQASTGTLKDADLATVHEALPYAELSAAIYNCKKDDCRRYGGKLSGWTLIDELKDSWDFHAVTYRNQYGNIAVVFEGTSSVKDWEQNFRQPLSVPDQYRTAADFAGKILNNHCRNDNSNCKANIILAGHSLGGGLAQYSAWKHGLRAFTFNPAGLWAPTANALNVVKSDADVTHFVGQGYHKAFGQISAKYGTADAVSHLGAQFGRIITIPIPLPVYAWDAVLVYLSVHGMENMLSALTKLDNEYHARIGNDHRKASASRNLQDESGRDDLARANESNAQQYYRNVRQGKASVEAEAAVNTSSVTSARTVSLAEMAKPSLVVRTYPASGISSLGATLNGYAANPTKNVRAWFEWGDSPALGQATPAKAFYSGTSPHQAIRVPAPGKTYYYRLVAESGGEFIRGEILSFFPSSALK